MVDFTSTEISAYYAARMPALKPSNGRERRGPCPVHQGKRDNFAVDVETGMAMCHSECGRGWDVIGLESELTGADFVRAKASVFRSSAGLNRVGKNETSKPRSITPMRPAPLCTRSLGGLEKVYPAAAESSRWMDLGAGRCAGRSIPALQDHSRAVRRNH